MIQVGGGGGPEWPTDAPEGEGTCRNRAVKNQMEISCAHLLLSVVCTTSARHQSRSILGPKARGRGRPSHAAG